MEVKWFSTYVHPEGLNFIITEEPDDFYVWKYVGLDIFAEDLKDAYCKRHQDEALSSTLEGAKSRTFEAYGVPVDSWRKVE